MKLAASTRFAITVASFVCIAAASASADVLLLRDGRIFDGKKLERKGTSVLVHFENGPVEVTDALIEDLLIEGETEFVPRTDEERAKLAQGLVPFDGRWVTPAQRQRGVEKRLAEKRAQLQEAIDHGAWGKRHKEETDHFRWEFTIPKHVWERFAVKGDAYYEAFCKEWRVKRDKRKPKLAINFFADRREFNRTSGAGGGALAYFMFLGDYDLCAYYDRLDPVSCEMILYHELNHYLQKLLNEEFSYPHWPGEALAEYYGAASYDPTTKKLEVGLVQDGRLMEVRQDILGGEWLPIRRVVTESAYTSYTWGWSLVHFLMNRPQYEKGFRKYFVGLANDKSVRREANGLNLKEVPGEESLRYLMECLDLDDEDDLDRVQAEWYTYIEELEITSVSGLERAGVGAKERGEPIRAKRLFQAAIDAGSQSALVYHHMAELVRAESPERAQELWRKAIELDPLTGSFWYELGRLVAKKDKPEGERMMALGKEIDPELGIWSIDF